MDHNTCNSMGAVLYVGGETIMCSSLKTVFQPHSEFLPLDDFLC